MVTAEVQATFHRPSTLAATIDEALRERDPVRAAWLAGEGVSWASRLERASLSVPTPPPPSIALLESTAHAAAETYRGLSNALTTALALVYVKPPSVPSIMMSMSKGKWSPEAVDILASVPERVGGLANLHGGDRPIWSRGTLLTSREEAKALPSLIRATWNAHQLLAGARADLGARTQVLADPATREAEEAAATLRSIANSSIMSRLPTAPPPSVLFLAVPPGQDAALSYRLAWLQATCFGACRIENVRAHQDALPALATVPPEHVQAALNWLGHEDRLIRLERRAGAATTGDDWLKCFQRAAWMIEHIGEAAQSSQVIGDSVSAAHASGIVTRAETVQTMAAHELQGIVRNGDAELHRHLLKLELYPSISVAAGRAATYSESVPAASEDRGPSM